MESPKDLVAPNASDVHEFGCLGLPNSFEPMFQLFADIDMYRQYCNGVLRYSDMI